MAAPEWSPLAEGLDLAHVGQQSQAPDVRFREFDCGSRMTDMGAKLPISAAGQQCRLALNTGHISRGHKRRL